VAATTGGSPSRVFLGYWAKWGTDQSPNAFLAANLNRIDLYSPYWYTLRSDGPLSSRESGHATLTSMVHAKGHKVIPLINKTTSNTPLLDPATRRKAVASIYQMLVANGFDGVNIGFGAPTPMSSARRRELWRLPSRVFSGTLASSRQRSTTWAASFSSAGGNCQRRSARSRRSSLVSPSGCARRGSSRSTGTSSRLTGFSR